MANEGAPKIIRDHLKVAQAQALTQAMSLRRQERAMSTFEKDIVIGDPARMSIQTLDKLIEGVGLVTQALSAEGLKLPNGEVFKVDASSLAPTVIRGVDVDTSWGAEAREARAKREQAVNMDQEGVQY